MKGANILSGPRVTWYATHDYKLEHASMMGISNYTAFFEVVCWAGFIFRQDSQIDGLESKGKKSWLLCFWYDPGWPGGINREEGED